MEKAVVRRGIGAVVLALVAALLLGYLLNGKKDIREKIVTNELPKAPIQIFPAALEGTGAAPDVVAGNANDANGTKDVAGNATDNAKDAAGNPDTVVSNTKSPVENVDATPSVAAASGAAAIAATAATLAAKSKNNGNVAGTVNNTANVKPANAGQSLKDGISGNPSLASNNGKVAVDIDKAGQPVVKAVNFDTTAPTGKNKVAGNSGDASKTAKVADSKLRRPLVINDNTATAASKKVVKNTSTPKRVVKNTSNPKSANKAKVVKNTRSRHKSAVRLVDEPKLKPVSSEVARSSRVQHRSRSARVQPRIRSTRSSRKITASEEKQIVAARKAAVKEKLASARAKKTAKIVAAKKAAVKEKLVSARTKRTAKIVAASKVVSKSSPVGRNKFTVQLLATSSQDKAKSLRTTFKGEGYNAYISNTSRGGKRLYQVRVGNFGGKSAATQKLTSMKRRYKKNKYIQSSMVVKL